MEAHLWDGLAFPLARPTSNTHTIREERTLTCPGSSATQAPQQASRTRWRTSAKARCSQRNVPHPFARSPKRSTAQSEPRAADFTCQQNILCTAKIASDQTKVFGRKIPSAPLNLHPTTTITFTISGNTLNRVVLPAVVFGRLTQKCMLRPLQKWKY